MQRKVINTFLVSVLATLILACTKNSYYEKSYSFEKNTWNLKVKPRFKVEIKDTSKIYVMSVTFRTSTDYPFSNVWMYLNTQDPSKKKERQPFEIKITNPDGTWIGRKSGTIVENMYHFQPFKFPKKGVYFFQLEQGVIQDELDEVLDVGIRLEEIQNKQ
jgi:gliding motility-associated lipoprotein GldH